jgi:hypothetical protein
MNYWLTIHWPPRRGNENTERRHWVFLPDGREQAGREIQPGDLVFIYESKTGRQLRGQEYDHNEGGQGIIALIRAISKTEGPQGKPERYEDGSEIWWAWHVRTDLVRECFIPREDVCRVLGYSANYNFRGFGDYRSGLKRLTKGQFEALRLRC